MDVRPNARTALASERRSDMADLRRCIGSERFGIEAHEAPVTDFPAQPSQKDGLGRMCRTHWNQYTTALRKAALARKAADGAAIHHDPGRAQRATAALAAWPAPVPLIARPDPPTFPVGCLPEWVGSFVRAEAAATQTPVDMAAMFALAGLATVAAGRVRVEPVAGWVEGPDLFIAVAMEPGSRKSAVHRAMLAPIVAYERLLVETAAPDIAARRTIRHVARAAQARLVRAAAAARGPAERTALEAEARMAAAALERLPRPPPPPPPFPPPADRAASGRSARSGRVPLRHKSDAARVRRQSSAHPGPAD